MKEARTTLKKIIGAQVKNFYTQHLMLVYFLILIAGINVFLIGILPAVNLFPNHPYYFSLSFTDYSNFATTYELFSLLFMISSVSYLLYKLKHSMILPEDIAICFTKDDICRIQNRVLRIHSYVLFLALIIPIDSISPWIYRMCLAFHFLNAMHDFAIGMFLDSSIYLLVTLIGSIIYIELINWMFRVYHAVNPVVFALFVTVFVMIRFFTFVPLI